MTDAAVLLLGLPLLFDLPLRFLPLFAFDSLLLALLSLAVLVVPLHLLAPSHRLALLELALELLELLDVGPRRDDLPGLVHDGHRGVGGFGGEESLLLLVDGVVLDHGLEVGGCPRGGLEGGHRLKLSLGPGHRRLLLLDRLNVFLDRLNVFLDFLRTLRPLRLLRPLPSGGFSGGCGFPVLARHPLAFQRGSLEFHRARRHLAPLSLLGVDRGLRLVGLVLRRVRLDVDVDVDLGRRRHGRAHDVVLNLRRLLLLLLLLLRRRFRPLPAGAALVRANQLVYPRSLDETGGHARELFAPIAREPCERGRSLGVPPPLRRRLARPVGYRRAAPGSAPGAAPGAASGPTVRGVPERGVIAADGRVPRRRRPRDGVRSPLRRLIGETPVEVVPG